MKYYLSILKIILIFSFITLMIIESGCGEMGIQLNSKNSKTLLKTNGLITLRNYSNEKGGAIGFIPGIRLINIKEMDKGETNIVDDGIFYQHPAITFDRKKVIAVAEDGKIVEYDIGKKEKRVIFDLQSTNKKPEYIRIRPLTNEVSFGIGNQVFLLSGESNNLNNISNGDNEGIISWMPDGNVYLYSYKNVIYSYNIISKMTDKILEGGNNPVLSSNARYLAFKSRKKNGQDKDAIVVKDMKTKKEYFYSNYNIRNYCFSPDENYIAIIDGYKVGQYTNKVIIWDFQSGKNYTVVQQIPDDALIDLDWK